MIDIPSKTNRVAMADKDGFIPVRSGWRPSTHDHNAIIITKSMLNEKNSKYCNYYELIRDDDDKDDDIDLLALDVDDGGNVKSNIQGPLKLISIVSLNGTVNCKMNFSAMVESRACEDTNNDSMDVGYIKTLDVVTKKELHPNALKSLEPLIRYFKIVCDSDMPFPGFRCGLGGSVSHRRPFLSRRNGAYLKDHAKANQGHSLLPYIGSIKEVTDYVLFSHLASLVSVCDLELYDADQLQVSPHVVILTL